MSGQLPTAGRIVHYNDPDDETNACIPALVNHGATDPDDEPTIGLVVFFPAVNGATSGEQRYVTSYPSQPGEPGWHWPERVEVAAPTVS